MKGACRSLDFAMESFEESLGKVKKGFVSSLNKVRGKEEPEPVPEDEQSFFSESVSGVRLPYSFGLGVILMSRSRKHWTSRGSSEQLALGFALV